MPELILSRREFAGVPVTMTTATALMTESDQARRVVVVPGRLSRTGGQIKASKRLSGPAATSIGR